MIEMNNEGICLNAIAGVFKDNGIDINCDDVRSMLKANKVLTTKALPKKEARKLIESQSKRDQLNIGSIQPA